MFVAKTINIGFAGRRACAGAQIAGAAAGALGIGIAFDAFFRVAERRRGIAAHHAGAFALVRCRIASTHFAMLVANTADAGCIIGDLIAQTIGCIAEAAFAAQAAMAVARAGRANAAQAEIAVLAIHIGSALSAGGAERAWEAEGKIVGTNRAIGAAAGFGLVFIELGNAMANGKIADTAVFAFGVALAFNANGRLVLSQRHAFHQAPIFIGRAAIAGVAGASRAIEAPIASMIDTGFSARAIAVVGAFLASIVDAFLAHWAIGVVAASSAFQRAIFINAERRAASAGRASWAA